MPWLQQSMYGTQITNESEIRNLKNKDGHAVEDEMLSLINKYLWFCEDLTTILELFLANQLRFFIYFKRLSLDLL